MNPSKEMVYNADVYGRVLDSANDPVLRSGRVGAIESVPPGESSFRLEIVVAFSQKPPLQLKNFKVSGCRHPVPRGGTTGVPCLRCCTLRCGEVVPCLQVTSHTPRGRSEINPTGGDAHRRHCLYTWVEGRQGLRKGGRGSAHPPA